LQTVLDRTTTAANRYSDSASLFQALGGGWWHEAQPRATSQTPPPKSP